MKSQTAATLCYVPWIGWIISLVVLSTTRFRTDPVIRFHAFQGLYLFVAWMIVDIALEPIFGFGGMKRFVTVPLKLAVMGTWIFMVVKTAASEMIRLPVIGEMAERSVNEQRA